MRPQSQINKVISEVLIAEIDLPSLNFSKKQVNF
jgi:hypothetical protein